MKGTDAHSVVVVGAGFAGLELVKRLKGARVAITLIDRRNHHLFQPLLYQVATSVLAPSEIAWPIRELFRDRMDVEIRLGEVVGVDRTARSVRTADGSVIPYDTLVLATGATHTYFGHEAWAPFAPGLKTATDAVKLRNRLLTNLEGAECATSREERARLLTFVVVGGGPTGVELAGMLADLTRLALRRDYRRFDTADARVVLVEAGPRLLPAFPENLSAKAAADLRDRGVDVHLGQAVTGCDEQGVLLNQLRMPAGAVMWAAGVAASPAAQWLDAEHDRAGRVKVGADLRLPGDPSIFVIGDTAGVLTASGAPVPGLAPAAKQQGAYVAGVIRRRLARRAAPEPFRYRHLGSLATIGRRSAIADLGAVKLSGAAAWWTWCLVHIYSLIGARSRVSVGLNWLWLYRRGEPGDRLIDEPGRA